MLVAASPHRDQQAPPLDVVTVARQRGFSPGLRQLATRPEAVGLSEQELAEVLLESRGLVHPARALLRLRRL